MSAIPRKAKSRHAPPAGVRTDRHLGRLVRLLTDNATVVVSGTKMAEELKLSRSQVWRAVEELRSSGVRVAGHPTIGYRLENVPDLLLPDFVAPHAQGTMFAARMHHYFSVGSTNVEALHAAEEGEPEGAVFLAEEQTAGRGRTGRPWLSEKSSGIYLSVLLRPKMVPAALLTLSLAAGLAVHDAVQRATGLASDLRWPNDVLMNGKKVCGILTEVHAEALRVRHAVVGIGLNVNQAKFPPELSEVATSLRLESGKEWPRVGLAAALLQSLDREVRALAEPAEVMRRFEAHSSFARNKRVKVEEDGGFEGVTMGLDENGFLRVRTAEGVRTVLSGGVRAA